MRFGKLISRGDRRLQSEQRRQSARASASYRRAAYAQQNPVKKHTPGSLSFGVHAGTALSSVPKDYLERLMGMWWFRKPKFSREREAVFAELDERRRCEQEAKSQ